MQQFSASDYACKKPISLQKARILCMVHLITSKTAQFCP